MPSVSHLTFCTATESNLYLANSLATAVNEPVLYRLLTFQVPNLIPSKKKKVYLQKKPQKVLTVANMHLHFLLNCRRMVIFNARVLECVLKVQHWIVARQKPLLLHWNPFITSKRPHNSLFSCFCSFFIRIIALRRLDAYFSESKPTSMSA